MSYRGHNFGLYKTRCNTIEMTDELYHKITITPGHPRSQRSRSCLHRLVGNTTCEFPTNSSLCFCWYYRSTGLSFDFCYLKWHTSYSIIIGHIYNICLMYCWPVRSQLHIRQDGFGVYVACYKCYHHSKCFYLTILYDIKYS